MIGSDILQFTQCHHTHPRSRLCVVFIVLKVLTVFQCLSRKIKISNTTLQSNRDSSKHFSPAQIKSAQLRSSLTREITNSTTDTHSRRTHCNTLPSHFFNYPAGENSGEGLSVCSSVSISSVNNTSLGQS